MSKNLCAFVSVFHLVLTTCVCCFRVFKEEKAHLVPTMSDTMDDQSAVSSQKEEEEPAINLPSTPTPQQQHTDPASPTVATTPEAPPVACGNKVMTRSSEMDLEYEVNICPDPSLLKIKDLHWLFTAL